MEKIITTSWDDGHPLDIKLSNLLRRYDIPATFYIPIENPEREVMSESQIQSLSEDFDIGGHTYSHKTLTDISLEEARDEIKKGKEELERITNQKIESFCYPKGEYNNKVAKVVKELSFLGARTVNQGSIYPKRNYKLGTTFRVTGNAFEFLRRFRSFNRKDISFILNILFKSLRTQNWLDIGKEALKYVEKNGGIIHIWGHSWEIEREEEWDQLEEFFKTLSDETKFKLMNNTELFKYLRNEK